MAWPTLVRQVVSLGTPHMGAPLEQFVHYASAGLNVLPETRPFSRFLRRRSAGIRDLRQGSLVDDDWRDRDPDALRAEACAEVPLLDGRDALLRDRDDHAQPAPSARAPDRRLPGAAAERLGPQPQRAGSASTRSTATTSAARTTSRC